jgi:threonine synthase
VLEMAGGVLDDEDCGSTLTELEGSVTGLRYAADTLQTTDPSDGRPLLARYDVDRAAQRLTVEALMTRSRGLWRWKELLPVQRESFVLHLGEGDTPLVVPARLAAHLDVPRLAVKAEGLNPTGSFKARGMAAAVSRNLELGARSFVVPSAGNAAGAAAAYAAAAGVPMTVVMPADVPAGARAEALIFGATAVLVDGAIDDCGRVSQRIAAATGAFDLSTLKEPYRVEGKKTMGFELAEQMDWELPDVIVYPTGGGTGLVGMWKGFAELERLGLIGPERPRMVTVQADGCAPIVRAFHRGDALADRWPSPRTIASGLRVPSAVGDVLILRALRESEGTAVEVSDQDIEQAQLSSGRLGLGWVSPESAAAIAATAQLRSDRWIARDERVVVFDTGIGHKYPSPGLPPTAPAVSADVEIDELLALVRNR